MMATREKGAVDWLEKQNYVSMCGFEQVIYCLVNTIWQVS